MAAAFAHSGSSRIVAFGGDRDVLHAIGEIGALAGLPVDMPGDISAGFAVLDQAGPVDVELVPVLALGDDEALDVAARALTNLQAEARRRNVRAVAVVPLVLLDLAMAKVDDPLLLLLCSPQPADLAAALALLAMPDSRAAVNDEKNKSLYPELRQLSEQVLDIARTLARLTGDAAGQVTGRPLLRPERPESDDMRAGIDAAYVRAIIRGRRLRDSYFPAHFFADPAWDMLLDLMAARLEQRDVAVSSLCIAAAVPPTTALRWIKQLTEARLFVRKLDPDDGRRAFMALSDEAAEGMIAYLAAARRISSPIV